MKTNGVLLGFVMLAFMLADAVRTTSAEMSYNVYFGHGTAALTDDAPALLQAIRESIELTGAKSVTLVGHCDTSEEGPESLSQDRAKAVADELRRAGLPASITIDWSGAGSADPDKKTGPGVSEPLNRRVSIDF